MNVETIKFKRLTSKRIIRVMLVIVVVLIILAFGYHFCSRKLTYKQFKNIGCNDSAQETITIASLGEKVSQTFTAPFDIICSVSVKIGTFAKDNNSEWQLTVIETESEKAVYSQSFNASLIEDGEYHEFCFDKNLKVNKGEEYTIVIEPKRVNENSQLAFYFDTTLKTENGDEQQGDSDGQLIAKIYGGDVDYWWFGLYVVVTFCLMLWGIRFYLVRSRGKSVFDDRFLATLSIGVVFFFLRCSFAVGGSFTDELDNMHGGIVIANGGVLYRDYITQHTPVLYYLCALFHLFGADSVSQFRLSYYILEAIIWGGVCARYSDFYGKRIAVVPILEAIFISSILPVTDTAQGYQILSDGWQGLMFAVLILEFLRFYEDRTLRWDRCIVVSLCIWGSIGAAFISLYSLVVVGAAFLVIEIQEWRKQAITIKNVFDRYCALILAITIPFLSACVYFKANGALQRAYEECYLFNRSVYPKYTEGYGNNVFQPFIIGIQNFFSIYAEEFKTLVTASASNTTIMHLTLLGAALAILIGLFEKKKYCESSVLLFMFIFSATRGYGFHGLAAWYIVVLIIAMNAVQLFNTLPKLGRTSVGLVCVVLLCNYIAAFGNNLMYEQTCVTELEEKVVDLTCADEEQDIFVDAYSFDSLYFTYKGRSFVNPAIYILPWYMDWYETDNMIALTDEMPRVIIYNEDRQCWDYAHYNNELDKIIEENYTRLSNEPESWEYMVWVRDN